MTSVPKMIGKFFEAVVCVLTIGLAQHVTFGCQTISDCSTETTGSRKQCCYTADPPRCMDWLKCYLYRKDVTKPTPVYTAPDYDRYTLPNFNRFTLPDYDRFTVPDFTIPEINPPTFSFDNDDHYNYYDSDHSSGHSSGATIASIVSVIVLACLIMCLRWVRYRSPQRRLQRNCITVRPPAPTNTSRENLVAPQNEEPSRIIIIAVTRDEDHNGRQNQPPDGEPPFLSEEDIILHNSCAQQPPSYEETIAGTQSPQNQGLDNPAINQPSPSTYSNLQAISSPNANPPSYEEALANNN